MTATAAKIVPIITAQNAARSDFNLRQDATITSQSIGASHVKDIAVDSVMNASSVSAPPCSFLFGKHVFG